MHTPLPDGAAQHVLVASAPSAEIDSGTGPETLAAEYRSLPYGPCFRQACPTAAAESVAAAAATAAVAATAAAPAAVAATAAAAGSIAAEEAHSQPCEVLVSWIWPTMLPLLLQVLCQAALYWAMRCCSSTELTSGDQCNICLTHDNGDVDRLPVCP